MTCAVGYSFVNNEYKLQDARHSYELFGTLNKGSCIDVENKLSVAVLCSLSKDH